MQTGKLGWLPLAICLLPVLAHAQEAKLEPGKAVEREIGGGESHTYQLGALHLDRQLEVSDEESDLPHS